MTKSRTAPKPATPDLPRLPGWAMGATDSPDAAAFRSGAALAHLALAAAAPELPLALWRDRLALAAAERCALLSGRREGQGALRDAVHLARPGDDPGPAGRILRQWARATARPVSVAGLAPVLEGIAADLVADCLASAGPTPVDRAAAVISHVLDHQPRAETQALILAEAVLSRALGWTSPLPVLTPGLTARDLRQRGDELRLACHRAVLAGVGQALPMAGDLARAAVRLRSLTPGLRARGAGRAVDLFLSRDALAPAELDFMSDRAARRLCDRLVGLQAVRELTGRDSYRLYGL